MGDQIGGIASLKRRLSRVATIWMSPHDDVCNRTKLIEMILTDIELRDDDGQR